jgi:hypothetical protein
MFFSKPKISQLLQPNNFKLLHMSQLTTDFSQLTTVLAFAQLTAHNSFFLHLTAVSLIANINFSVSVDISRTLQLFSNKPKIS